MNKLKFKEIAKFKRMTDCYGGNTCDELIPYWRGYVDGDKESSDANADLILDCKVLPAGTRIIIEVPCCPNCGEDADMAFQSNKEMCRCNEFNWKDWELNEYS